MTHDHDREVIVTDRGSGVGAIVGVIVVVALLFGIWFFALGPGRDAFSSGGSQPDINVDVNLPSVAPNAS